MSWDWLPWACAALNVTLVVIGWRQHRQIRRLVRERMERTHRAFGTATAMTAADESKATP